MSAYYNEIDPYAAQWVRNLIDAGHIAPGDVDDRSIVEVQPDDLRGYTQCHFFAGIGGWSLALRMAGWGDARSVWTGSCPCQPFSAAGKGKGAADERHLWPEFYRLIRERRPPIVFGEQVASAEVVGTDLEAAFVVAVQRGDKARANKLAKRLVAHRNFHFHKRWLDGVQANLEEAGYSFGFKVLGAHSVGAPHIRQRLWWVGDAEQPRLEGHARHGDDRDEPGRDDTHAAGPVAEAGGDIWSRYEWIPCADDKARRIGIDTIALVDGLPGFLGAMRADEYAEAVREVNRYGQEANTGRGEVLRAVRETILQNPSAFWEARDAYGVREEEILLAFLRELEARCEAANEDAPSAQAPEECVRGMRTGGAPSRAPHRREPRQLVSGKHPNALHLLSWLLALDAGKAWAAHCEQNAGAIAPLTHGEQARAGKLRAYGNAIVPQVAAAFIKAAL